MESRPVGRCMSQLEEHILKAAADMNMVVLANRVGDQHSVEQYSLRAHESMTECLLLLPPSRGYPFTPQPTPPPPTPNSMTNTGSGASFAYNDPECEDDDQGLDQAVITRHVEQVEDATQGALEADLADENDYIRMKDDQSQPSNTVDRAKTSPVVPPRKEEQQLRAVRQNKNVDCLKIYADGEFPPPEVYYNTVPFQPFSRMANVMAMAQSSLYASLAKSSRKHLKPIIFDTDSQEPFGDCFYRVFAEVAANPDIPLGTVRISVMVNMLLKLVTESCIDAILDFITGTKPDKQSSPIPDDMPIASTDNIRDSESQPVCLRLSLRQQRLRDGQIAIQPAITSLYRLYDAAIFNSLPDTPQAMNILARELGANATPSQIHELQRRLRVWMYEGRLLGTMLESDKHKLGPGFVVILNSLRNCRELGMDACHQFGESICRWPGLQRHLLVVTEQVLFPALDGKNLKTVLGRLQDIKRSARYRQEIDMTFWVRQTLSDEKSHVPAAFRKLDEIDHVQDALRSLKRSSNCTRVVLYEDPSKWWPLSLGARQRNAGTSGIAFENEDTREVEIIRLSV